MRSTALAVTAAASTIGLTAPASAGTSLSVRDSFRIGTAGTIFCTAQTIATDPVLKGMFDAGYTVTCRDAALPVGKMYKLRDAPDAPARLAGARAGQAA